MPLYLLGEKLEPVSRQSLAGLGIRERDDLQRVLRDNIEAVAPGVLVIAEEFSEWSDSRRRIDLLGVHQDGSLVVVELKRTRDGGHMDLQAIRYAAMVAPLTYDRAVEIFRDYLASREIGGDAEAILLEHLGWEAPGDGEFGAQVRILLAGPDFGQELTTAVLWLNSQGLDITCVRLDPYAYGEAVLLDVQQIIPLPEAADYSVRIKEKNEEVRAGRRGTSGNFSRFDVTLGERVIEKLRRRRAIFAVVRHLVGGGVAPEDIQAALPENQPQRFFGVPGHHGTRKEFESAAADLPIGERRELGRNPRWFVKNGELLHHGGKTYAFSNAWGSRTEDCMARLSEAFPGHGISVKRCG